MLMWTLAVLCGPGLYMLLRRTNTTVTTSRRIAAVPATGDVMPLDVLN
jgi:hypothetical protein